MIVVIIAGGSGTRLWPLSTPEYPKHLLKLIGDQSLMQNAFERAKQLTDTNKIYLVTESGHAHHVREQLPELGEEAFIVEPGRRGTAGCIIAGIHHIQSRHDKDEPIAFIHADHSIRDIEGFVHSFKNAAQASHEQNKVTLIGIEPTYPATGFGYIQKDGELGEGDLVYKVAGFKEKPEYEVAQDYLKSGHYYWNCGYFVGSVNTFLQAFKKYSPEWKGYYDQLEKTTSPEEYKQTYLSFKNDAIDYALLELDKELLVAPATFDWMDLGSFKDAHEAVERNEAGNYMHGDKVNMLEVENSFIRNDEPHKDIAVIGLDNVVVINTPHGVLVARKDLSQRVGEIAKQIQAKKQESEQA